MPQEVITLMTVSTLLVFDTNHIAMFSDLLKVEKFYLKCILFTFYLCKYYTLSPILIPQKCHSSLFLSVCGVVGVVK